VGGVTATGYAGPNESEYEARSRLRTEASIQHNQNEMIRSARSVNRLCDRMLSRHRVIWYSTFGAIGAGLAVAVACGTETEYWAIWAVAFVLPTLIVACYVRRFVDNDSRWVKWGGGLLCFLPWIAFVLVLLSTGETVSSATDSSSTTTTSATTAPMPTTALALRVDIIVAIVLGLLYVAAGIAFIAIKLVRRRPAATGGRTTTGVAVRNAAFQLPIEASAPISEFDFEALTREIYEACGRLSPRATRAFVETHYAANCSGTVKMLSAPHSPTTVDTRDAVLEAWNKAYRLNVGFRVISVATVDSSRADVAVVRVVRDLGQHGASFYETNVTFDKRTRLILRTESTQVANGGTDPSPQQLSDNETTSAIRPPVPSNMSFYHGGPLPPLPALPHV
jgi:hypothetical protein